MKAGIVGAGALGSLFAHIFQRAGIPFAIYENDISVVEAINSAGLTLIENGVSETIHPIINCKPAILSDADIIILFVKSYSTESAVESIIPSIKNNSVIVSLQNGLGNYETIARHIDEDRIVLGTTTIGATKTGLSTVAMGGKGGITIGSISAEAVEAADQLFSKTGYSLHRIFNPHIAVWKKAIINAGINPIASILDIHNGEILEIKYATRLQEKAVEEAVLSARASGINLDYETMIAEVRDVCTKTSANVCSMLQDIRNKRRTEIDSINGVIMDSASKAEIKTPVTETLYLLIKGMEAKFICNY